MSLQLNAWRKYIPSFQSLLIVSALLRIGLISYSEWHDARSVVKYTDVDYRVFSDAARFLVHPSQVNVGQGPLTKKFSLAVGNPYTRETYRYTPLLAVLLLPNELIHASFGKYLFAVCDLINGVLIYRLLVACIIPLASARAQESSGHILKPVVKQRNDPKNSTQGIDRQAWATFLSATHLLNPLVFSISTRGSSESVLCTFVLLTLFCALKCRWDAAAVMLGISTHWKIYPVIYGVSCVAAIASQTQPTGSGFAFVKSLLCKRTTRFALLSAGTFFILGALCHAVWGYPFLYESYLYHTVRLDHRHNFSPYFYLTYLTYPGQGNSNSSALPLWRRLLRSPLTSLIPQLSLSLGAGLLFGKRTTDLPFAWFVQTYAFVLFNRVCTSQYFLWYTLFLPLLAPRMRFSWSGVAVWAGTQALWLAEAYKLEFLGEHVFFSLWLRSLVYVAGHAWVLGKMMEGYAAGTLVTASQ
ncbi:glycosyltransferase family 50 protein [Paxillus rubicundulus Ve08.2h10]|uniref:GPI mannosyltransferase 1 n=1 Tax=Paxillus rubicundulus Ve08.2h10 TaxID=930991 RepID=A0A0D0DL33_9AGAM|nr:glycosyltransferase family 50 protein [Paxillus rubicundulus Ve08.2h10]